MARKDSPQRELRGLERSTHAASHLGQVGYLRRTITGENKASGALALESLV